MKIFGSVLLVLAALAVPGILARADKALAGDGHALSVWIAEIGWCVIFAAIGLMLVRRRPKKP